MTITMSSREFNQDTGRAKQAAKHGPVFITDRGRPAHVLLSIEEFDELSGRGQSLAQMLSHPQSADIEFDIPKLEMGYRIPDFE